VLRHRRADHRVDRHARVVDCTTVFTAAIGYRYIGQAHEIYFAPKAGSFFMCPTAEGRGLFLPGVR